MFAVLHFPQFPLQAVLRHEPAAWERPLALVDPGATTPRVIEATMAARQAGVQDGLTPPQALARCRQVEVRHRSVARETEAIEAVVQVAYAFSPHLEVTGPGCVTLDLRGLPEWKGSGTTPADPAAGARWAARLQAALEPLGLRAWVGLGATPNVARLAARWGGAEEDPGRLRQVTDAVSFVRTLPVSALEPSSDVADLLRRWGIGTVGEFLDLGQAELADRLGLEALGLCAAASVTSIRPLHLVEPPERFEEGHEWEDGWETLEPLLFLARRCLDALAARLEARGVVAARIQLRLQLESGALHERSLTMPQPTRRSDVLFRVLHTHLEGLRTESAVCGLRLEVEPARPDQQQFNLFEPALRDPYQLQETLARLAAIVGPERVGSPRREPGHRPDAFRLVPPEFDRPREPLREEPPEYLRAVPWRRIRPGAAARVVVRVRPSGSSPGADAPAGPGPALSPEPIQPPSREDVARLLHWVLSAKGGPPTPAAAGPTGSSRDIAGEPSADSTRPPGTPEPEPPEAVDSSVARGRVRAAIGPWRSSGSWWNQGGWQREEWEVSLPDGQVVRLAREPDGWQVEGVLD